MIRWRDPRILLHLLILWSHDAVIWSCDPADLTDPIHPIEPVILWLGLILWCDLIETSMMRQGPQGPALLDLGLAKPWPRATRHEPQPWTINESSKQLVN